MNTSLVDEARARLLKFQGHYQRIARESGISYSWLTKFAQGRARNPTLRNLEALHRALEQAEKTQPNDAATAGQ